MKDFEIIELLPLHKQITLVIFRNPDTRKCEVQILPVSLKTVEIKVLQEMLKIPADRADTAIVSVEAEESLNCEILDWCEARGITSEQLLQAFVCFCGEPENIDVLRLWIRQENVRNKIDVEKFSLA